MNLQFRPVTKNDWQDFSLLMAQLSKAPESRSLFERQVQRALDNPDMYLMCAETEGRLVGSLIGLICEDFCGDCRPILFIENVVTLEECRGKGVGRQMFAAIEDWGKTRACSYAVLVSGPDRLEAHTFYRALGYSEAKGFKKYL